MAAALKKYPRTSEMEISVDLIRFLFRWHGRITGRQLFVWTFGVGIVTTLASMFLIFTLLRDQISRGFVADSGFWALWYAGQLPGMISSASLVARRLHDLGHSARWLIPAAAYFAAVGVASQKWDLTNTWPGFAIAVSWVAATIWLFVAPGERRENHYGPAPAT